MKNSFWIFLYIVGVLIFTSCNKKNKTIVTPSTSPTFEAETPVVNAPETRTGIQPMPVYRMVSLQRLGCFGDCPDFEFVVLSNGEATYHGKKNTSRLGTFKAQAGAGIIFNIKNKITNSDYFKLEKMYPTNGKFIKELPDTYILINDGNQQLIIKNNHDAPVELLNFEKYLEDIIEKLQWEKVG